MRRKYKRDIMLKTFKSKNVISSQKFKQRITHE